MQEIDATKFWITNGWIISLLVIIGLLFYFFGIFEFFFISSEKCMVGDGFECVDFNVKTISVRGLSQGEEEDVVSFLIKNNLDTDVNSFHIIVDKCNQIEFDKISIPKNQTSEYIVKNCNNIKPNSFFNSKITTRYVIIGDKNTSHISYGTIFKRTQSPLPDNFRAKSGDRIKLWIQQNVG
ncbi:MAG: hypothetical protein ACMXYG_05225 [Candidatus Woesearchaeota archaeon]